jgi:hypothetical protein
VPSLPVSVTFVAFEAVTLRVEDPPALIELGVAVTVTFGAGAAVTVTVAVDVALPPAPVAVAVYVVVTVGDTLSVPPVGESV